MKEKERCEICKFYNGEHRDCRRYPPVCLQYEKCVSGDCWNEVGEFWPDVCKDDWCGEFKAKQEPESE